MPDAICTCIVSLSLHHNPAELIPQFLEKERNTPNLRSFPKQKLISHSSKMKRVLSVSTGFSSRARQGPRLLPPRGSAMVSRLQDPLHLPGGREVGIVQGGPYGPALEALP